MNIGANLTRKPTFWRNVIIVIAVILVFAVVLFGKQVSDWLFTGKSKAAATALMIGGADHPWSNSIETKTGIDQAHLDSAKELKIDFNVGPVNVTP